MKKKLVGGLSLLTCLLLANPVYAADTSPSEKDTVTAVPPTSVTHNADGSTTYVFNANGYQNIIETPPKNFNPLTASNADLVRFGYPPRPTTQPALDDWTSSVTKRTILTPDYILAHSNKYHCTPTTYAVSPGPGYDEALDNWSGQEATATYNEWDQVQAGFYAPKSSGSSPSGAEVCNWVGLGGDLVFSGNNSGLLQDGFNLAGPNSNPSPWYEWVGPNNTGVAEQGMPGVTVHQGDKVSAFTQYDSASATATFELYDYTTNTGNTVHVGGLSAFYSGMTAEFIDERPEVNCQYAPLLNYGSDTWTGCQVHSIYNYWNNVGTLSHQKLEMMDPNNSPMSAPSALNSTNDGFTEYFHLST